MASVLSFLVKLFSFSSQLSTLIYTLVMKEAIVIAIVVVLTIGLKVLEIPLR